MSAAGVCSQPKNGRELKEGGFRPFCYGNCRVLFNKGKSKLDLANWMNSEGKSFCFCPQRAPVDLRLHVRREIQGD